MTHDLWRRHRLAAHEVVGQVEQAAQVVLVAGNAFPEERFAVGGRRGLLQDEAALGAHRHDDRVLDHLGLHQPQHLGAEVVGAVGPAQAAARDLSAAQVDALEAWRIDPDLVQRHRLGQARDLARIQLEAQELAARAGLARVPGAGAPVVGAQRRLQQRQQLAQHPVFGQVADLFQRLLDGADLRGRRLRIAPLRLQPQLEQAHQHARDARMRGQGGGDGGLGLREPDLLEVLGIGPEHHDLVGRQARLQHEPVEIVALDLSAQHAGERVLEQPRERLRVDFPGQGRPQLEIVQRNRAGFGSVADRVAGLRDDAHSHVLQHGQAVGQHQRRAAAVDLQPQGAGVAAGELVQRQPQRLLRRQGRPACARPAPPRARRRGLGSRPGMPRPTA